MPRLNARDAPPKVQKYVLRQLCETLPVNSEQQKAFVTSGSLAYVQELNQTAGGKLQEQIETLNSIYPPNLVEYYTPGYVDGWEIARDARVLVCLCVCMYVCMYDFVVMTLNNSIETIHARQFRYQERLLEQHFGGEESDEA